MIYGLMGSINNCYVYKEALSMKIVILFLTLFYTSTTLASDIFGPFGNKRVTKEDFNKRKCIKSSTKIKERLSYQEICKYGANGCLKIKPQDKQLMYCQENLLSKCFENKSWVTSNQLVGLPEHIKIGLFTQGLSFAKGAMTGQTCAYYDKKK